MSTMQSTQLSSTHASTTDQRSIQTATQELPTTLTLQGRTLSTRQVTFDETAIDNEHMQRKSSKGLIL